MPLPQYADHFGTHGSSVLVTLDGATADLFSDAAGTDPLANPITVSANGFVSFHAAPGNYVLTESGNGTDKRTVTLEAAPSGTSVGVGDTLRLQKSNVAKNTDADLSAWTIKEQIGDSFEINGTRVRPTVPALVAVYFEATVAGSDGSYIDVELTNTVTDWPYVSDNNDGQRIRLGASGTTTIGPVVVVPPSWANDMTGESDGLTILVDTAATAVPFAALTFVRLA